MGSTNTLYSNINKVAISNNNDNKHPDSFHDIKNKADILKKIPLFSVFPKSSTMNYQK